MPIRKTIKSALALIIGLLPTFMFIPQASATSCSPTSTTYGSYTVLSFTTTGTCTWTAPSDISTADILLIGGGGGGGGGAFGGGGGAGGFVEKLNHTVTSGNNYTVIVGSGGTGGTNSLSNPNAGADGDDSTFDGLTAKGGGGGAGFLSGGIGDRTLAKGRSGGSGGGASEGGGASSGGSSTQGSFTGATTSGNIGGSSVAADSKSGGGGGGAGSAGGPSEVSTRYVGGIGGSGASSTLRTGSAVTYSAGGDGGSNGESATRSNEASNTGNGGDGAHWNGSTPYFGGDGGSGILVIRYIANISSDGSSTSPQIWLGKYSIDCPLPNPSDNDLIQTANKITPVTASSENLVGKNISQETLDLVGQNEIYFDFWSNKVKTATIELPTYGCSDKLVRVKQNSSVQFIAGGFNLQSEARGYLQTPEGTWFDLTGVTLTKDTAAFLHTIKFVQPGKYLIVLSEQPDVDQHKIPTYGYKNARFVLEVTKKKSTLSTSSEPAKTSNAQSIALENLETVAQVSPWQEKNSNPIYLYLLIITLFSFLYFVNKKPALSNYPEINIEDKFANFIEEMYSNIKINN